ncbi:MAG TPA: glycosyltransferase, partial [Acidimicrobiales bacterium]|nr:glycosyltransferase [Acidimicrobiales bacterium]
MTRPPRGARSGRPLRVAYVMSRFPKLSETFVLREVLAVEAQGVTVDLYPLVREREPVVHPEAAPLVGQARYLPFLSLAIVRSNLWMLRHRPRAWAGALWAVVRGNWGSANLLVGGLGVFPKVVHAARLMEADGVDHVHCHFATHPALAGFLVHRLTGIPFSFTAHGSDLHVDRHMLPQKVREAAFAVPISDFNRRVISDECGPGADDKLVVVHCGVDPGLLRPRPPRAAGPFTIVCVGTLHEVKGQTHLVEACRLLAAEGIDFRCHLVGSGPDEAALRRQVAAGGLEERVLLDGRRTTDEVAELLQRVDVLVAPSVPTSEGKREGIPVVLIEAMSSAVPVIASDLSGIPELVEDGRSGLLVPAGDVRRLAGALRRLAEDPALAAQLGAAGRAVVEADFDVHRSAERLVELFTGRMPVAGAAAAG